MNITKKNLGFRIGEPVNSWVDRFGKSNGRIKRIIRLKYLGSKRCQVLISNGDILTSEFMLDTEYIQRFGNSDI